MKERTVKDLDLCEITNKKIKLITKVTDNLQMRVKTAHKLSWQYTRN